MSINRKYCIVKTTNEILSVTGKIADNKLENIITEMLYPACKRIMCNFLLITYCLALGMFMYLSLPAVTLPAVFPSEQVDVGIFWNVHPFDLSPFCGRTELSFGSGAAWHCSS